ncbi:MAG: M28 family peptidase [Cytophagales bacterium]|jgi:Zn-dependent M28 family amino/carboxypeptidase|nr:M28 family peptidase [Bacteroidota bacterium]WHZ08601.1 MAG: M28 family peptidase [Cytophagales bacterium]
MKPLFLYFSLLLAWSVRAQIPSDLAPILDKISPDAIKAHMTFLSDDLLEGRKPGTRGFALASKYMESQFIALGLLPGNGSSYIQSVPLVKGWVEEKGSGLTIIDGNNKEEMVFGKDFLLSPYFPLENSTVNAPLVFVGFGVSAPEFNYDDYKNIDVKGKIVVYLNGAPKTFPSSERAYFSTGDVKYNAAIQRGAVGIISFSVPTDKRNHWPATIGKTKFPSYRWANDQGVVAHGRSELKAIASFNNAFVDKLFIRAKEKLETIVTLAGEGKSKSFSLNISAAIQVKTKTEKVNGSNLVGVIKGSDPALSNEYIVYSSHLDHLGIGTPKKNDSIYNGAHDDASGNGILLEIAKAYKSLPVAPKRSIAFAVVTGEELGLLGSDYFINNLPLKNAKVVANLAIDMPFFFHPILDFVPYGADHSSLGKQTQQTAQLLGLKISPDPFPEQVVFIRSDHYSFIKKGIPALFIKSGFMTVPQDTVNRAKSDVGWRSTIYHSPQDDMSQPFDFNAATMHVKINFLTGYFAANEPNAPTWNEGDFFGKKFSKTK